LPPLRERPEDIALIARSLLEKLGGGEKYHLTDSAIRRLQAERFPGNVRELRNVLERGLIFARSNVIDAKVLERCLGYAAVSVDPDSPWLDLRAQEKRYLKDLLAHCSGDKHTAAEIAGVSVRSLYRKLGSEG